MTEKADRAMRHARAILEQAIGSFENNEGYDRVCEFLQDTRKWCERAIDDLTPELELTRRTAKRLAPVGHNLERELSGT